MRILAEDTMAIVVDFQDKLVPVINGREDLLKKTEILIKGLQVLKIPMVVTQQYTKGLGKTVENISNLFGEEIQYLDKLSFSCYDDEGIVSEIEKHNKNNIIIFGTEAHICVLQTVIDCLEAGFHVIVIEDCIGSRKESDKATALKRFMKEGAIISSYESILFELTRKAGTDTFKEISRLIK